LARAISRKSAMVRACSNFMEYSYRYWFNYLEQK